MDRRSFLRGLAGCFAAAAAPGVIGSGVLMPVKRIVVPEMIIGRYDNFRFIESPMMPGLDEVTDRFDEMAARIARIKGEILAHCEPREILGLGWSDVVASPALLTRGKVAGTIKFRRLG